MGIQAIVDRFRGKALKFTTVSIVGTVIAQTIIVVTHAVLDWPGAASNITAVTLSSIPSYILNRYWVWAKFDKNSLHREVLPFWLLTLAGLALSTIFVVIAERFSDSTLIVQAGNVAGFGVLWVAKFIILDAVLFRPQGELESA